MQHSSACKIDHINLVVRDLAVAGRICERILGRPETRCEHLSHRDASIARFKLRDTWLSLSLARRCDRVTNLHIILYKNGEGFFLLSFDVGFLADASQASEASIQKPSRDGFDDWHIQDLAIGAAFGAQIQYCEYCGNK